MFIRQSQLNSANERSGTDLEALQLSNEDLVKTNEDLAAKIEKLDTEITELVQRVDINTLLREVD
jgi:cell division protein FtsB